MDQHTAHVVRADQAKRELSAHTLGTVYQSTDARDEGAVYIGDASTVGGAPVAGLARCLTTTERTAVVWNPGYPVYDTDLACLFVGDGVTAGGVSVLASSADLAAAGGHRQTLGGWYQDNVPASQSATAMGLSAAAAFGESAIVPRAGSVTGLVVKSNADVTDGALTATVTVNGVPTALAVVLDATHANTRAGYAAKDAIELAAGDLVAVTVATNSAFTPDGTADVRAAVEIEG